MTSQRPQLRQATVFDLLCITEAVEVFFRCKERKKKAWLVQRILSRWHFHSIGATVALTEGNLQEINLKAEGEPEIYLQRITPKLFVCFPWDRKWKSAKQMAVTPLLTPDFFGGRGYCSARISRAFVIVAAAFLKNCNESCHFLWKMSKHFQCSTLVYWKRAQYFNKSSIFFTFGFWVRLQCEDIQYDMKSPSGCPPLDASLPPVDHCLCVTHQKTDFSHSISWWMWCCACVFICNDV